MSLGLTGPITQEMATVYGVAVTFFLSDLLNQQAATCKICDAKLAKGKGLEVFIEGLHGYTSRHFFCQDCVAWVKEQRAKWEKFADERNAPFAANARPKHK